MANKHLASDEKQVALEIQYPAIFEDELYNKILGINFICSFSNYTINLFSSISNPLITTENHLKS